MTNTEQYLKEIKENGIGMVSKIDEQKKTRVEYLTIITNGFKKYVTNKQLFSVSDIEDFENKSEIKLSISLEDETNLNFKLYIQSIGGNYLLHIENISDKKAFNIEGIKEDDDNLNDLIATILHTILVHLKKLNVSGVDEKEFGKLFSNDKMIL